MEVINYALANTNASDYNFSYNDLDGCQLSMVIRKQELSITILDNTNHCLSSFILLINEEKGSEAALQQLLIQHEYLLRTNWASVKIGLVGAQFTLIPSQIFQPDLIAEYGKLLFQLAPGQELYYYPHGRQFVNLFAQQSSLISFIYSAFGERAVITHQASGLIEGFLGNFNLGNSEIDMLVQVEDDFILVLVKRRGQLLFCNSYQVNSGADIAYFVLLVMKELGMNPETDVVSLYGQLTVDSEEYATLYKYIRYIYFGERPAFISFSAAFDNFTGYRHFDTFGLHLCR
jgi:Protein of unknown function (DUF3822)